jgi:hypothetical protein
VLVNALQANEDVLKLEVITERILHQERKFNDSSTKESAMTSCVSSRGRPNVKCYHCGKTGHIRKNCYDFKAEECRKDKKEKPTTSQKVAASVAREDSHSNNEDSVLISIDDRALYTMSLHEQSTWIVDSWATTHRCHDKPSFTYLYQLDNPIDVLLRDGRALTAVGRGKVVILPNGESKSCTLCDVLCVPQLSQSQSDQSHSDGEGSKVYKVRLLYAKQEASDGYQSREPLSA